MSEGEGPAQPARRKRPLWRRIIQSHDFARDITVTTLGVLIALAIGAVVEELRWRGRSAAMDRITTEELGLLHSTYIEKIELQPCVARRLTELTEIIGAARDTGRLPLIEGISAPPNHGGFGDSWELTLGTETALHMSPRELMTTATAWANERSYSRLVDRERDAFDRLMILESRPGPISSDLLTNAEAALVEAKVASDSTLFIARQDQEVLRENHVPALWRPGEALDMKRLRQINARRRLCHPLKVDGRPYRLKGPIRVSRPMLTD